MTPFKTLKTLCFALCAALSPAVPSQAAGTLPLAMAQQIDINGQPLAGCIVSFFVAGTVASPQNSFSDFGLSQNPNPVLNCDQSGRIPMFWLADGLVHVRLTDSFGSPIIDTTMQVLGPSSGGGGGGGTVDPTTIAATGDLKWRLDKTPISGWVRANGLTIGSATSGSSERANADTQSLFIYIWTTFSQPSGNVICPVVGGLGANALADFNANKQITLEDARARSLFALDDMGNSALGGFTGVTFTSGTATTGGANGGTNSTTLALSQLPTGITSGGTGTGAATTGTGRPNIPTTDAGISSGGAAVGSIGLPTSAGSWLGASSLPVLVSSISATSNNTGGTPFPSVPRALLGTLYWKL